MQSVALNEQHPKLKRKLLNKPLCGPGFNLLDLKCQ